jgi:hypothetical protein
LFDNDRALFERVAEAGRWIHETFDNAAKMNECIQADVICTKAAVDVMVWFLVGKDLQYDAEDFRQAAENLMNYLVYSLFSPLLILKLMNPSKYFAMERMKTEARRVFDDVLRPEIVALLEETKEAAEAVAAAKAAGASDDDILKASRAGLDKPRDRVAGSFIESLLIHEPRFRNGLDQVLQEGRVLILAGFEVNEQITYCNISLFNACRSSCLSLNLSSISPEYLAMFNMYIDYGTLACLHLRPPSGEKKRSYCRQGRPGGRGRYGHESQTHSRRRRCIALLVRDVHGSPKTIPSSSSAGGLLLPGH